MWSAVGQVFNETLKLEGLFALRRHYRSHGPYHRTLELPCWIRPMAHVIQYPVSNNE